MADTETQEDGLSPEVAALAALGRGEEAPAANVADGQDTPAPPQAPQRPDHVPEKFWDAEKGEVRTDALLKSYTELEKTRGKPQEPPAELKDGEEGADDKAKAGEDGGASDEAPAGIPAELFTDAQVEFAETGDLSAETREKIIASGIPSEFLDTYLAGVKALSASLTEAVYNAAGGQENYDAAVAWARENWSEAKVSKFDTALNDPDLMPTMVTALISEFRGAVPGEGNLTRPSGGVDTGDLYTSPDEFTRDLAKADEAGDVIARRQAVAKLERSKKAGTLKHVTPRNGAAALRR